MPLITTLVVRTSDRPSNSVPAIREAVAQTDADVTVLSATALRDLVSAEFSTPRFSAVLLTLFGAGAVILAAVGVYSLLGAAVKARRRELAIRQAIGATPGRLRLVVAAQGLWLCGAGIVIGLAGGVGSGQLLGTVLYGVTSNDVYTVLGVVVVLVTASLTASYIPARRATRSDLVALLRDS